MKYKVTPASLPDVLVLEPVSSWDEFGILSFDLRAFHEATQTSVKFVQDNHSRSLKGVLRGLHYQIQQPQGKLISVVSGRVLDVTVDLRRSSPHFGNWASVELSESNAKQLWIPPGFAHGFLVLSDSADVLYKTTEYYAPQFERCIAWNDPAIGIEWSDGVKPLLSEKDQAGVSLATAEVFA